MICNLTYNIVIVDKMINKELLLIDDIINHIVLVMIIVDVVNIELYDIESIHNSI